MSGLASCCWWNFSTFDPGYYLHIWYVSRENDGGFGRRLVAVLIECVTLSIWIKENLIYQISHVIFTNGYQKKMRGLNNIIWLNKRCL